MICIQALTRLSDLSLSLSPGEDIHDMKMEEGHVGGGSWEEKEGTVRAGYDEGIGYRCMKLSRKKFKYIYF